MTGPGPDNPKRICLIKPSALGDVVTAIPVLRALRRRFPQAHIAWLVRDIYARLLAGQVGLDETITYDRRQLGRFFLPGSGMGHVRNLRRRLREGRFDWAIDLQGLARSGYFTKWTGAALRAGFADARELAPRHYSFKVQAPRSLHTIDRNIAVAEALGCPAGPEDLRLDVSEAGRKQADGLLDSFSLRYGQYVVLAVPTTWQTKMYPERYWNRLAAGLSESYPLLITGTRSDVDLCGRIAAAAGPAVDSVAGQTGMEGFVALLASAAGVVCCDSAAKFIAQAVRTPAVCLIGPTDAARTGLWGRSTSPAANLVSPVCCQGCLKKHCRHITCMQVISPDDAISASLAAFQARSR
ncbi:MAG: glycosyltransferase family 9 protein [Phycisphaerae bacterium]